ncbi:integumentary mucin B.1-like [Paroedura picta]|uniref:integumentary mucin B.1-like n=1 Tax=Paroedura picta TaxID=143630 RepID=UPI0040564B1C
MKLSLLWFVILSSVYDKGECVCFFKKQEFAIDETFKDSENPCLTYTCTKDGFTTNVKECRHQSWCIEELRTYDGDGCCYTCKNDNRCQLVHMRMDITRKHCKGSIKMYACKGACKHTISYNDKERKVRNKCSCCKETRYVPKKERLFCIGGRVEAYKYNQVASCDCIPCKDD